jgi:hypothetical protein
LHELETTLQAATFRTKFDLDSAGAGGGRACLKTILIAVGSEMSNTIDGGEATYG